MINCKCECLFAKHGECTKTSATIAPIGCLSKMDIDGNTYAKVINHYGGEHQIGKLFSEINEFTDAIMGNGNVEEELADILNMIEQFKMIEGISNEKLHDIMQAKMKRTFERIKGESGR